MTTRLLLAETRRYAAVGARPAWILLALTLTRPVVETTLHARHATAAADPKLTADATAAVWQVFVTGWSIAVVGAVVWMVIALVRVARQPVRDAEAAARLQALRDRALIDRYTLVEIHHTLWATQAGQHVLAVDIATGDVRKLWLPEVRLPDGSFAGITTTDGHTSPHIHGWAPPEQVAAERRHQHREVGRHTRPTRRDRRTDRERRAELIAEAERAFATIDHPGFDRRRQILAGGRPLPIEFSSTITTSA